MIQFKEVNKVYPNGVQALLHINLEITKGEFVLVTGPSGAGKSTFNKLITREEKATKGEIWVNAINLSVIKEKTIAKLRRNIGIVFQDYRLFSKMTVFENVAFAQEAIGVPTKLIESNVYRALNTVGLLSKAKEFPINLSGGEQQRVSIARAIVNKPQIMIADEPTGNLDIDTAWDIFRVFEKINDLGTTILMTTHNKEFIENTDKRVIYINSGRIVQDRLKGVWG